jgi:hypothetical protein
VLGVSFIVFLFGSCLPACLLFFTSCFSRLFFTLVFTLVNHHTHPTRSFLLSYTTAPRNRAFR